jgi:hypothetical protein
MKLIQTIATVVVGWWEAYQERQKMARVEHELQIKRELDYVQARLTEDGSTRVLTSEGVTQAVSDDYFRRTSS